MFYNLKTKHKLKTGEIDGKVEGSRNTEKVLSATATMVSQQKRFLNSRGSRMANTVTF